MVEADGINVLVLNMGRISMDSCPHRHTTPSPHLSRAFFMGIQHAG
ncbi:hypothetical protein ACV2GT_17245 [Salmonella enterica subsp. enterica serovar Madelia]